MAAIRAITSKDNSSVLSAWSPVTRNKGDDMQDLAKRRGIQAARPARHGGSRCSLGPGQPEKAAAGHA